MGGLPAGKVRRTEHSYDEWELRVDALMMLLVGVMGGERRMTVDELRKNIESLPPADYDKMGYYDRWVISLTQSMIQRGVITTDELAKKLAEVENRGQSPISARKRRRAKLNRALTPIFVPAIAFAFARPRRSATCVRRSTFAGMRASWNASAAAFRIRRSWRSSATACPRSRCIACASGSRTCGPATAATRRT